MTRSFHGLDIDIPGDANDESMYRFVLADDALALSAPLLSKATNRDPKVRTSVVISRIPAGAKPANESAFEESNQQATRRDPGFRVLGTGRFERDGRELAWQDVTLSGPNGLQIFQRQVMSAPADGHHVLIAITSGKRDLEQYAVKLGLAASG